MRPLRIALAQINSTVGDFAGNLHKISASLEQARKAQVDLIAFPELALTGYPPEDLLLRPHFVEENLAALARLAPACFDLTVVVGFVDRGKGSLYNAAAVIHEKKVRLIYHKRHLPNYGVFDEARYFQPGLMSPVFQLNQIPIGINICEDIWISDGPIRKQAKGGARFIINISASPYRVGVETVREQLLSRRAKAHKTAIAYVNAVGGQDELVFDGASLIMNAKGSLLARAKSFQEQLLIADLPLEGLSPQKGTGGISLQNPLSKEKRKPCRSIRVRRMSEEETIYRALMTGLSDYVRKNRFEKVGIGLSGGVDSALTAVIAVDTLGPDRVKAVFMPSRYTSKASHQDAKKIAERLGIELLTLSIEPLFCPSLDLLAPLFDKLPPDVTEENLQSRIRGNIMMALSNKFGWLILTTGNKSEMSVGYATLYGDMAGGFALIKDLWKTVVYRLSHWRQKGGAGYPSVFLKPFPERVLTRPPTAELRHNQTDQETLPPYEVLDPILRAYVEEGKSFDQIEGFPPVVTAQVMKWVDRSEFKRRQAPVGVRITPCGLGRDRRMPITHLYRSGRPAD
jgi:NAD+ synthase (glutamine-hydrolysing)